MNTQLGGLTPAAMRYMLDVTFRGKAPADRLFMGLSRRPPPGAAVDLAELTRLEPRGAAGYKRASILAGAWRESGELAIETPSLTFENTGAQPWPTMEVGFVTTSEDGAGELLAWTWLRSPRLLLSGDRLVIPARLGF